MSPSPKSASTSPVEQLYSIQFVAKLTGINSHTIRAWEKRYQAVVPTRDRNGRRLYKEEHIQRLIKLYELTSLGNNISDLAYQSIEQLDQMYETYAKSQRGKEKNTTAKTGVYEDEKNTPYDINSGLQNLIMALTHYKLDVISHELEKMKLTLGPREFSLSILQPLLVEVASQVDSGALNIAQEHALSAILKFHMGHMLYQSFHNKLREDLNITLATPQGELHEFGIMIAALLCSHYRIKFIYLGSNMPALALSDACKQINSKILILGVSRNFSQNKQSELDDYLYQLSGQLTPKTKIWLGGAKSSALSKGSIETISTLQMLDHQLAKI